ncbi:hypothetical protein EBU94_07550, partial [bacterium]|nr:hypothetical protein [bacterium]
MATTLQHVFVSQNLPLSLNYDHLNSTFSVKTSDEKIVEYFPQKVLGPKAKGSAVDSTGNVRGGTSSGKKSYDNLPADAKEACDRFIANGWIKS